MIVHVLDQRVLEKGEGPIGLVVAPTRELCQQIYNEYQKYSRKFGLSILPLFGGMNQHDLWKEITKGGHEIAITTPGRIIDVLRKKGLRLDQRCTFLVIDEADQMFDLGFEYQIRSIVS